MNKLFVILTNLLLLTTGLHAATDYSQPSNDEISLFYTGMMDHVNRAQMTVDNIVNETADPTKIDLGQWVPRLKDAIFVLRIKYALAWDFRGSPILRSEPVRQALLSVMEKEKIDGTDIENLQKLVTTERTEIIKFDAAAKAGAK